MNFVPEPNPIQGKKYWVLENMRDDYYQFRFAIFKGPFKYDNMLLFKTCLFYNGKDHEQDDVIVDPNEVFNLEEK